MTQFLQEDIPPALPRFLRCFKEILNILPPGLPTSANSCSKSVPTKTPRSKLVGHGYQEVGASDRNHTFQRWPRHTEKVLYRPGKSRTVGGQSLVYRDE